MSITLTPDEVFTLTGRTVTTDDITIAASMIDYQTGYSVDEHFQDRHIPELQLDAAWAMVAVRVDMILNDVGSEAVTSETQGDYSYSESDVLAGTFTFANITDGRPWELLNMNRARWTHI